jgi:hypothetical protein
MALRRISMARVLAIGIMLAVAISWPTVAQQRTPNAGKSALSRVWPVSGVWITALIRPDNSPELLCASFTDMANNDEEYAFGWREDSDGFGIIIIDSQRNALSGDSIALFIDDVRVLQAPITTRNYNGGELSSVIALISGNKVAAIKDSIRSGGSIKFVTDNETYSASLTGSGQAMSYFGECLAQAQRLNALLENK